MAFDTTLLNDFPTTCGVYLMKDATATVLYVGKANNLRQRVRQYFSPGRDERAMIPFLTAQINSIEIIVVSSEKEALLLENNLIKKHQPRYNVLLKDDKGYISLKLASPQFWPKIQLCRHKGSFSRDSLYFGPYTHAQAARDIFSFISKTFPLRQCSDEEFSRRKKPCLLYQIKRCLAPCVNLCSEDEYNEQVKQAIQFLKGKNQEIILILRQQMEAAAEKMEYEKAGCILNKIRLIEEMTEKQKVDKKGMQDLDALGLYRTGYRVCICQLQYREGRLLGTERFYFDDVAGSDSDLINSFILQHYLSNSRVPSELILSVPGTCELLSEILSESQGRKIGVYVPQKGEKKEIIALAIVNARSMAQQTMSKQEVQEKLLLDLQEKLELRNYPQKIECFDNSHWAGSELVSAMVVYVNAVPFKSAYRRYRIREVEKGDDFKMLREVLTRRYKKAKEENNLPDLIIVDGGKGQLNSACQVLSELDIATVDVISLAKEKGRHDRGLTQETVFSLGKVNPIPFEKDAPLLFFLQSVRDETHRFAISFQRKRRVQSVTSSALDAIPGIGPIKKRALLKKWGSVKAIQQASEEELLKMPQLTRKDVKRIIDILNLHDQ